MFATSTYRSFGVAASLGIFTLFPVGAVPSIPQVDYRESSSNNWREFPATSASNSNVIADVAFRSAGDRIVDVGAQLQAKLSDFWASVESGAVFDVDQSVWEQAEQIVRLNPNIADFI